MKKNKKLPSREVAIDYVYEYNWKQAAELLKITEQQLDNIINGLKTDWKKPHINENATVEYVNPHISKFVNKHYSMLHTKYVKNILCNIYYQNDEDVFHTALIKLCSDTNNPSEIELLKKFDVLFKSSKYRYQMNYNQMKRKEELYGEYPPKDDEEEELNNDY